MISKIRPERFDPKFEATGCYIVCGDEVLFLKRAETDDDCQEMWVLQAVKLMTSLRKIIF